MENTMQLNDPKQLQYVFDLKGSTVDRKTGGHIKPSTTLKDNNFMLCKDQSAKSGKEFISLEGSARGLKAALRKDVKFLQTIGLMDYSLLLAVEKHDKDRRHSFSLNSNQDKGSHTYNMVSNAKVTYHISIIDYLQDWNLNKRSERFIKTVLLQKDSIGLSACEPKQYGRRFQHFMEMNVLL